jgi:hypothetical protein
MRPSSPRTANSGRRSRSTRVAPLMGGSTTLPSRSARYVTPAIAAPTIGAIQNSHSCSSAQPPDEDRRPGREPAACPKTHRHGRIEVAAGNRSERVGTGEHAEPERERHTEQPGARAGNAAANTALPQPPNTSQNVPRNSAQSFPAMRHLRYRTGRGEDGAFSARLPTLEPDSSTAFPS